MLHRGSSRDKQADSSSSKRRAQQPPTRHHQCTRSHLQRLWRLQGLLQLAVAVGGVLVPASNSSSSSWRRSQQPQAACHYCTRHGHHRQMLQQLQVPAMAAAAVLVLASSSSKRRAQQLLAARRQRARHCPQLRVLAVLAAGAGTTMSLKSSSNRVRCGACLRYSFVVVGWASGRGGYAPIGTLSMQALQGSGHSLA